MERRGGWFERLRSFKHRLTSCLFFLQSSFPALTKRSIAFNGLAKVEEVDLVPFMTTAPIYSSFGDLGRFGFLEGFRPSAMNDTLTVNDIDFSMRVPLPSPFVAFFEYDGQFRVKMSIGRKYSFAGEMDLRTRIIKELFDALILN